MPWSWVEFNLWSQSVNKSFYMASVLLLWWTYLQNLSWYLFDSILAWIQKYHMCIAGVARYVCFISFKLKTEDVSVPLSSESWLFCPFSLPVQATGRSTNWGTFICPSRHLQTVMNGLSVSFMVLCWGDQHNISRLC